MKLFELFNLLESFPVAKKTFQDQADDPAQVPEYLNKYRELAKKRIIPPAKAKDIVYWTKQGWDKFKNMIDDWKHTPTKSELKKIDKPTPDEYDIAHEDEDSLVVVPHSHNASCYVGRDTDWCTTKKHEEYFADYVYDRDVTLFYVINKHTGDKNAIAAHHDLKEVEYFDKNDNSLSREEFDKKSGIDSDDLIQTYLRKDPEAAMAKREKFKSEHQAALKHAQQAVIDNKRDVEHEHAILRNPKAAVKYAEHFFPDGWPQAERAMLYYGNPDAMTNWAKLYYPDGWPEAEKILLKGNPEKAVKYAREVKRGDWPEFEKLINAPTDDPDTEWERKYAKRHFGYIHRDIKKIRDMYDNELANRLYGKFDRDQMLYHDEILRRVSQPGPTTTQMQDALQRYVSGTRPHPKSDMMKAFVEHGYSEDVLEYAKHYFPTGLPKELHKHLAKNYSLKPLYDKHFTPDEIKKEQYRNRIEQALSTGKRDPEVEETMARKYSWKYEKYIADTLGQKKQLYPASKSVEQDLATSIMLDTMFPGSELSDDVRNRLDNYIKAVGDNIGPQLKAKIDNLTDPVN